MEKIEIKFDTPTWGQVEELSDKTGKGRKQAVRMAVRIVSYLFKRLDEGYSLALIKKGEPPRLIELVFDSGEVYNNPSGDLGDVERIGDAEHNLVVTDPPS